jgi:hypothetical protein
MNPLIRLKTPTPIFLIVLVLACFSLLPKVRAVSPPPDGGYPGGNTAEGQNALFNLTTGRFNTAVGFLSLRVDSTNSFNTAIGAGTLLANAADQNTATGAGALLSNSTGSDNTAVGAFALFNNTTGNDNTATGLQALLSNTDGVFNSAFGWNALGSNTTAAANTAVGSLALFKHTINDGNTAIGYQAVYNDTTGADNVAIGPYALLNSNGGFNNIAVGYNAGNGISTASNVICIGHPGADVSTSTWIGNVFGVTTQSGATLPVIVSDAGQLGTATSSRRFKDEIKPMGKASEAILAFTPVRFRYKSDKSETPQFGLIAEDVEKVNRDLVVRDKEGKPYSVRYDQVNAMLLNEFLKEHRKVQELEATLAQQQRSFESKVAGQQKQIEAVTAGLQKVSAQLEASKPAQQTVLNNQ